MSDRTYDVAVLGSGIAGAVTATVLARQGLSTLMIDAASHPRFAIGESTISQTTLTWRALAQHFDVPELAALGDQAQLAREIGPTCGLKRHFGFAYHEAGEPFSAERSHQFGVPEAVAVESHLYRQDVDAWVAQLAIRKGAEAWWGARVEHVEQTPVCMRLATQDGREARARFLVDASGFRSPVAQQFGLREENCSLKTHSRSSFTHMIGVRHLEDVVGSNGVPYRWSQGTLHHAFRDGWVWVIPFDNHEASSNPRCSVGVQLDPRTYPANGLTPEDELTQLAARYPSLAAQLADALPVRPWTSTPRIQYASTRVAGERFVLTSHAAGFIDPLFSRGLTNSASAIFTIARRIMHAHENSLSSSPFEGLDQIHHRILADNDDLVHGAYVGTRSYPLWDAWLRVWVTYMAMRSLQTFIGLEKLKATGDASTLDDFLTGRVRHPAVEALDEELWRPAIALKDQVAAAELDADDAAEAIYQLFAQIDLGPIASKAGQRAQRYHGKPNVGDIVNEARWFFTRSRGSYHLLHADMARYGVRARLGRPRLTIPAVAEGLAETMWRGSRDVLAYSEHLAQKYPIASINLGARRAVLLSDLDLIDEALIKKSDAFGRPKAVLDAFKSGPLPTAEFLMSSVAGQHRHRRRLLGPAFSPSALAGYAETMVELCDEMIDSWSGRRPVLEAMTAFTLDVAGLTLFGMRIGDTEGLGAAFEQWTADIDYHFRNPLALPRTLPTRWNLRTRRAVAAITKHLDRCISARRDTTGRDAVSLLLAAGAQERLDPQVIRGVTLTLYLAGHDTTATALAWSLYLLAKHPSAWARLAEEAANVLDGRTPRYGDHKQLPYALGVYKEALRLYPPTFALVREAQRAVEVGGYTIPSKTLLIAPIWGIHRDPRHYDNPTQFKPERWIDETPRAFYPFGVGPFSCLGGQFALLEGVLVLARLAQRATMRFSDLDRVRPKPGFSLKPAPDFHAELTPRNGARAGLLDLGTSQR